ncbi:MAG: hypothetical protein CMJ94_05300 [Planctomycetes bacterium]|nr:hypothetical protein [Planctomycetota bacterium]
MSKKHLDGRWFTSLLFLAFAAWVWFFFWSPNKNAAMDLLERRTQPSEAGSLQFPLTVRIAHEGSGRTVSGATVEWEAPDGSTGRMRTNNLGEAVLQLPALGRYRLRVLDHPGGGHGPAEIPYRYKVGAEREPVTIPVPRRKEDA